MFILQSVVPHPLGRDSWYHIRMALMLPEQGIMHTFPWIHWSIFRDHFVSHHYGFHVLLSPWVWITESLFSDPVIGAKLFNSTLCGFSFVLLCELVRTSGGKAYWAVLLVMGWMPYHFWLRMAYIRAPSATLPFMLLGLLLVMRRNWKAASLVFFLGTHLYSGAILYFLIPLSLLAGHTIAGSLDRKRIMGSAVCAGGVVLGFLISPYFPENLAFLKVQIFESGLSGAKSIGSEWKPYSSWILLQAAAGPLLLMGGAVLFRLRSKKPWNGDELGVWILQGLFFILTCKSRRFIEYWPVFALISAFWILPSSEGWRGLLPRYKAIACILAASVSVVMLAQVYQRFSQYPSFKPIRYAASFLDAHAPEHSLVFIDDWDLFSMCFYAAPGNRYVVGLDPKFTETLYPDKWTRYRELTRGRNVVLSDILTVFESKYAIIENTDGPLAEALMDSPQWHRCYLLRSSTDRKPLVEVYEFRENLQMY